MIQLYRMRNVKNSADLLRLFDISIYYQIPMILCILCMIYLR